MGGGGQEEQNGNPVKKSASVIGYQLHGQETGEGGVQGAKNKEKR